ncbi:MAG TPA: copper homeostasis protein CutC [Flavobacteriales bacterium]
MRVDVEVCVTSVAEAQAAERGGADTVELCSWRASGGITPSAGLIMAVQRGIRIPVRVLVRPTPHGFVHSEAEQEVLLADAQWIARSSPAPRLVTGGLKADGSLDLRMMAPVRQWSTGAELTFHKAIDAAVDPLSGLEHCLQAGVQRILTAGAAPTAFGGIVMLKAFTEASRGKAVIAAAGGISAQDVVAIVEGTGVTEVHFAAQKAGPYDPARMVPDEAKVEAVMIALDKAGLR